MSADVLGRVRKLLALAGDAGATEAEAAAAAAAAQRLIELHRLDVAALDAGEPEAPEAPPEEIVSRPLDPEDRAKAKIQWRGVLGAAVAASQGCRSYWWGARLHLVGPESRIAAARYLYAYLAHTVESLGAAAGRGRGRSWTHAWRVGCASRLAERVRAEAGRARSEAQAEAQAQAYARGGEGAIVRVNAAIERDADARRRTDAHFAAMSSRWRTARTPAPLRSGSGYHAGRAAGEGVRLSGGPALGAGASRLAP